MSEFVRHEECPACGSSDALAIYDDGHSFCFSCDTTFPAGEAKPKRGKPVVKDLIEAGTSMALSKRKLTQETCEKFGYTASRFNDRPVQVAPYYDNQGLLVAQHIRFPDKDFLWRGKPKQACLFGQHLWRDKGRKVVITEGEIDAMSVSQLQGNKWPVVSVPNGAAGAKRDIKRNLEWLEGFEEVVFMFDMDEPGQKAAKECALLLTPGKAKIARLPFKDANECLQRGEGKAVIAAMWDAKAFRPDGIVSGEDLWETVLREPTRGYPIPWPKTQELLYGIRKGELYLFTAGSGIGKSTAVFELGHYLASEHNLSIGVIALEEGVKRSAERFMGIHLNRPIHINRDGVGEEQLREAYEATVGSGRFWFYDHFGSTDVETLISKIRYMIVGLGVDFVILDHISIVVSGLSEQEESERKTIDRFMTALRSLIEETRAGVLAVVHLKRPQGAGKSFNEGRAVTLTDLRGSGSLEQISDVVIALERDQTNEERANIARVKLLKNRPVGRLGYTDHLAYNHDTGRLLYHELGECPFAPDDEGQPDF